MNSALKIGLLIFGALSTSCCGNVMAPPLPPMEVLARSYYFEEMYHDLSLSMGLSMSMSMEYGIRSKKGKGRKGKKSKKEPGFTSKSSKKVKSTKSSKAKGKEKENLEHAISPHPKGSIAPSAMIPIKPEPETPSVAPKKTQPPVPPVPTEPSGPSLPTVPTGPVEQTTPTRPTQTQSTSPPVLPETTPPAVEERAVMLAPYNILYTVDQSRIPNLADYRGVTDVTAGYLNDFFRGVLDLSQDIVYSRSTTENTDREFRLGQPVRIEYNTSIYLSKTSTLIPGEEELNALLMSAFRGAQNAAYLEAVKSLSLTNIFASTTKVEFVQDMQPSAAGRNAGGDDDISESGKSQSSSLHAQKIGVSAAAAAGALIVALTGYAMYRRRTTTDDAVGKFLENDGHLTVAGETFVGTSSLDSQSGVHRISRSYEPTDWNQHREQTDSTDSVHHVTSSDTTLDDLRESDSLVSDASSEKLNIARP